MIGIPTTVQFRRKTTAGFDMPNHVRAGTPGRGDVFFEIRKGLKNEYKVSRTGVVYEFIHNGPSGLFVQ